MIRDISWMDSAVCAQIGPDPFEPGKGETLRPARNVCRACPVRVDCLDYALAEFDSKYDVGVWGGKSAKQRREMRKRA